MEFQLLPNNQVLRKEVIVTPNQEVIEWKPIGMLEKINMQADKATVSLEETVTITLQWQIFDL